MSFRSRPLRVACASGAVFAALWTPVQSASAATVIDFEPLAPTIVIDGDVLAQGAFSMMGLAVPGSPGSLVGAIDTAASCFVATCPTGNDTSFYQGLNDSRLTLARSDAKAFSLIGFDAGFLAAAPLPSVAPGMMQIHAIGYGGKVIDMSFAFDSSDDLGNFAFKNYGVGLGYVTSVDFFACTFDASGACVNMNENLSQFGLDNIGVAAAVPEPSTYVLSALGLAALALRARRASRKQEA
jgi:hypothetical protein